MCKFRIFPGVLLPALLTGLVAGAADEHTGGDAGARTVIGEKNPQLAEGARRLLAGDAEEGVRLTRLGMDVATSARERHAGFSNLCAGYLRLEQYDVALGYCNEAIDINPGSWRALSNRALAYIRLERYDEAQADLDRAEEIAPNAGTLARVRAMWRDATDPVEAIVIIDDRRGADVAVETDGQTAPPDGRYGGEYEGKDEREDGDAYGGEQDRDNDG